MTLGELADSVQTREQLAMFVSALRADLEANAGDWENAELWRYLEAMEGWIVDCVGYYKNSGQDIEDLSPWTIVADVLMAARDYE